MSDLSRRNLLARAPATAVAILPMASVVPARAAGSRELHAMWNERRALKAPRKEAEAAFAATVDSMPWWARPGRKHVDVDGNECGPETIDPAIINCGRPQSKGGFRVLRPSKYDLRRTYEFEAEWGGRAASEKAARVRYRKKLRELATRLKAQKAEEVAAGMPQAEAREDKIVNRIWELGDAIEASADATHDALAAKLLLALWRDKPETGNVVNTIDVYQSLLETLRPHLTGNIAADVADLLDNPDTPVTERVAWL